MPGGYGTDGGLDVFELIQTVDDNSAPGQDGPNAEESGTLLVVGDTGCGKSTLIQSFLKPNSNKDPKPTFALEYNFARKKNAGAGSKSLAHIWELGGDIKEPSLLDIPLPTGNLPNAAVMIVVDMSKPENVLTSLQRWIQLVREHIQARMSELKTLGTGEVAGKMKVVAKARYGEEHEDLKSVRPCEVPMVIVGNKFDAFRSKPSADRRALIQAVRFMAHYHGASFIATSRTESAHRDMFRGVIGSVAFGVLPKAICEVSGDKPAQVSAGKDTFRNILLAVGTGKTADEDGKSAFAASQGDIELFVSGSGIRKDCWGRFHDVLSGIFGQPDVTAGAAAVKDVETGDDEEKGERDSMGYPEADIDEARATKDLQLEQYTIDAARRARLNAAEADEPLASASRRGVGEERSESNEIDLGAAEERRKYK